jgi:filamentous hemagglutinin family protein
MSSSNVRFVHRLMTFVGVVTPLLLMFFSEGRVARSQVVQSIVPDAMMGNNNSLVDSSINNLNVITGGTVIGNNNFHSFQNFSVPTGQNAYFLTSPSTQNIITRVTGNNSSLIDGTIGVRQNDLSFSAANLFFFNPNGIVFGKNARLEIGGSFTASTANALIFNDVAGNAVGSFSTRNTSMVPLLSIAPNVGLYPYALSTTAPNATGANNIKHSGELSVLNGRTIRLIGGDVVIDGGKLFAPSGRIELGGFNEEGVLTTTDNYNDPTKLRSNVSITNGSIVGTFGSRNFPGGFLTNDAGVVVFANNLTISNSEVNSGLNVSSIYVPEPAGNIYFNALDKVTIKNSQIRNPIALKASGNTGDIIVVANNLDIQNSLIEANASGIAINNNPSNAGRIFLSISKDTTIGQSTISSTTFGQGNTGLIIISGSNIKLVNSGIFANVGSGSDGVGSGVFITANSLSMDNSSVNASIETNLALQPDKKRSGGLISFYINDKLSLTNGSQVRNSVEQNAIGDAASIFISANEVSLDKSYLLSVSEGKMGNAGSITLSVPDGSVNLVSSEIDNFIGTGTVGNAQQIKITAKNLFLDNSKIFSNSYGYGNPGAIDLDIAKGFIGLKNQSTISNTLFGTSQDQQLPQYISIKAGSLFLNTSGIVSSTAGKGNAGSIILSITDGISLTGRSQIRSASESNITNGGSPGFINIQAKSLELLSGSQIISAYIRNFAGSSTGTPGYVLLSITDSIKIDGYATPDGYSSGIFTLTDTNTSGDAGYVQINTKNLTISNGGVIAANTYNNSKGGVVDISTDNLSLLSGGQIVAYSTSGGSSGNVVIYTGGKVVVDGFDASYESRISNAITQIQAENSTDAVFNRVPNVGSQSGIETSTFGSGNSGVVLLVPKGTTANSDNTPGFNIPRDAKISSLEISNYGYIGSRTGKNSTGESGGIFLTLQSASLNNGGLIILDGEGIGKGGFLSLSSEQLNLDASDIRATARSGNGGNLNIAVRDRILLRNNSNITASSGQEGQPGNGGNINIANNKFLIAAPGENSDISANAFTGNGGKIDINSQAVIGLQFRKDRTPLNDITASSEGGGRDGVVSITSPGVDPGKDLGNLPDRPIDASNQITQRCTPNTNANQFTVTGRGGLPTNPRDPITSDVVWQDTRNNPTPIPVAAAAPATNDLPAPAQNWTFNKGLVTLVPSNQPPSNALAACPTK